MAPWPPVWRTRALEAASIPVNGCTLSIMLAWKKSTPLPPESGNPIGMPAGSSGSGQWMSTRYAAFPSQASFYAAFATFIQSYTGQQLAMAMTGSSPYAASWRVISQLNWPGSLTETDYPAELLDLTSEAYRQSVGAAPVASRKTSGVILPPSQANLTIIRHTQSLSDVTSTLGASQEAVSELLRRSNPNG